MVDVAGTLAEFKELQAKQSSALSVEGKAIPLKYDLRNLTAYDANILSLSSSVKREEELRALSRDNCQLLFNEIFNLPTHSVDLGVLAVLPQTCDTLLPREKPLPTNAPQTRWEKFAKSRGIVKRKKDAFEYSEEKGEDLPRFGGKSAKNKDEDWCLEVKDGEDPYQDLFAKKKAEKKERVRKNDARRKRNLNQ